MIGAVANDQQVPSSSTLGSNDMYLMPYLQLQVLVLVHQYKESWCSSSSCTVPQTLGCYINRVKTPKHKLAIISFLVSKYN